MKNKGEKPLISIVTVCFNAEKEIEKTIRSVINQTYRNIEYIIIDGASKDWTVNLVNKYRQNIATFISEPDSGIYDAMNKGIMKANGQWINFMNAGDTFASDDVLQNLFSCKDSYTLDQSDVIYGDCICCISIGEKYNSVKMPFWENTSLVPGKGFSHQSVFVKTSLAKQFPFNLKYKICADFDMMYNLYTHGYNFSYKKIAISKYEVESGFSKKHANLALKENAMIVGVYGKMSFKLYYLSFIIKNNIRKVGSTIVRRLFPKLFNYIKLKRL